MSTGLREQLLGLAPTLAKAIIDDIYRDSFWLARYGEPGRRHALQDAQHHVTYLVEAWTAEDPGVFEHYARWLRQLLAHRGMCSLHLDDSFKKLGEALTAQLPHATPILPILQAGRAALLYEDGPAKVLQQHTGALLQSLQADEAICSPARAYGPELRTASLSYVLAYLADALHYERPALFRAYVLFLIGHLQAEQRPTGPFIAQLDRLDQSLQDQHWKALKIGNQPLTAAARPILASAQSAIHGAVGQLEERS